MSRTLWLQQKLSEKHACSTIGLNHPSSKRFRRISDGHKSPSQSTDSANYSSSILVIVVEVAPHVLLRVLM